MNYPPYPLSKRSQNIIWMFFVIAFFIAAPIVTLYATGYRIDKKTFQITKTGVLSIDILPSDAQVFLDNTLTANTLPLRKPQMTPGTYHLEIRKEGYLPWIQDIVIEENKTTYIKNIELFLVEKPVQLMNDLRITTTSFSNNGNYALQEIQDTTNTAYVLFNTTNKISTNIKSFDSVQNIKTEWSPKNSFLVLQENLASSTNFLLLDPNDENQKIKISFEDSVLETQWTENIFNLYKDNLFIRGKKQNTLVEINGTQKTNTSTFTEIPNYRDNNGIDWYVDSTKKYIKKNNDQSLSLSVGQNIVEKIIHINDNRIIAKTTNGIIVIEQKDNQIKTLPCTNYFFDNIRKEYIAWSKWELWTIYENGEVALLNRMSDPIESVRPLDKFGELLIATNHKLLAFNPGYYVTQTLLNSVAIEDIAVNREEKIIYFFGNYEGKSALYSLKY